MISAGRPLRGLFAQLVELPPQKIGAYWRKYLEGFAECLIGWKGDPASRAARHTISGMNFCCPAKPWTRRCWTSV